MKRLIYKSAVERHLEETERIVKICEKFDYTITQSDANKAWIEYTLNCVPYAHHHWAHIPRGIYSEKFILNVMKEYCTELEE